MRLTPIDIQQQQFHRIWRGVDSRQVQSFLDLVAQQLGELVRENGELRVELRRMTQELDEHRNREETLRQAMLTAQRAIDEIRENAKKEAQVVIADAELRARRSSIMRTAGWASWSRRSMTCAAGARVRWKRCAAF